VGEVTALRLADVKWRDGTILIRGKGNRQDVLPLPENVGRALAEYLRKSRVKIASNNVFLRVRAPHGEIEVGGIKNIVRSACLRAGIPPINPHLLRHTVATKMLHRGGSLSEIAQVLRHQSIATTAIYAKLDRSALREIVRKWLGDEV
jgi:site-specific recombinase XerD